MFPHIKANAPTRTHLYSKATGCVRNRLLVKHRIMFVTLTVVKRQEHCWSSCGSNSQPLDGQPDRVAGARLRTPDAFVK